MGTIVERARADGSVAFRAQILIKSNSRIVHQESSTFDRRSTAEAWLKNRERELHSPGGLEAVQRKTGSVADILKDYLAEMGTSMGRTKTQVLRSIRADFMIAEIPCEDLRSKDIVDLACTLRRSERDTSTAQNYLSHLSAALSVARTAWGYDLDRAAVEDGMAAARHLGHATKSKSRDRHPNLSEIDSLMAHFMETGIRDPRSLPMHRVMTFELLPVSWTRR